MAPDARNARLHSEEQIAEIARSIQEWGWTVPVVVDEKDSIIAGHGRVLAAQSLGYTSVPAVTVSGCSDEQKQAYRLADNKIPANATWDMEKLTASLTDLSALLPDISITGFSAEEVRNLTARPTPEGKTDPDDVPDAPVEPITAPGDVWLLGRHRLTCGDPTDPPSVDAALAGVLPHLMVTDL